MLEVPLHPPHTHRSASKLCARGTSTQLCPNLASGGAPSATESREESHSLWAGSYVLRHRRGPTSSCPPKSQTFPRGGEGPQELRLALHSSSSLSALHKWFSPLLSSGRGTLLSGTQTAVWYARATQPGAAVSGLAPVRVHEPLRASFRLGLGLEHRPGL